jgi:hypothetical protein
VLIKQTAWLMVKTVIVMGAVTASLIYLADEPASQTTVAQHLANIAFW